MRAYSFPLLALHDPPFQGELWEKRPALRGYAAFVHIFPRPATAWWAWKERVPVRVGTARRWYHWLTCTRLPKVSRRHSGLHETQLNFAVLAPLLPPSLREKALRLSWSELLLYRPRLRAAGAIPSFVEEVLREGAYRVALHVGSGGGAPQWPLDKWIALASQLTERLPGVKLILTGNAAEEGRIGELIRRAPHLPWVSTVGRLSLSELVALLERVDCLVGGSTGPLHIAAAVGTPVVGLFPATAAMGPWRWRPLTEKAHLFGGENLCLSCPQAENCTCLNQISEQAVAEAVIQQVRAHSGSKKL